MCVCVCVCVFVCVRARAHVRMFVSVRTCVLYVLPFMFEQYCLLVSTIIC